MGSIATATHREPWNKGKIVGQKAPFKLKDIWALRVRFQMENRVRELHGALHAKTQELDASSELVRKLRAEYQTTRQDAEGMLQVMGGLERQLSEYAAREADVNKRDKSCKEQEEEMAIFKEQVCYN